MNERIANPFVIYKKAMASPIRSLAISHVAMDSPQARPNIHIVIDVIILIVTANFQDVIAYSLIASTTSSMRPYL